MFERINWISVAVASLSTFVVGAPWYSPFMFLARWQKEMNLTDSKPGHPIRVFGLAFVFSVVACALLSTLLPADVTAMTGLRTGLLVGVCFVATSFGINYQFANRSFVALLIDGGYHVLQFAAFGLVLGAWPS
jgi:predicted transporter